MTERARITRSLNRLCHLERKTGALASALTDSERSLWISRLRLRIPGAILSRHDHLIGRGRRSIAPVINGVCSACHLRLPIGYLAGLRGSPELGTCAHCGTYVSLEPQPAPEAAPPCAAAPTLPRAKRKAARKAAH